MEASAFRAALQQMDDLVLLEAGAQQAGQLPIPARDGIEPTGYGWPKDVLRLIGHADKAQLLRLQYWTESYYSERITASAEPSEQDILLALAYLRVVELQFIRGEPDMGFSARELAFVLAAARRLPPSRRSDPSVLEIGCGAGNLLGSLAEHGIRSLRGVDVAPAAVEKARERLRPWGLQDRVSRSTPSDLLNERHINTYDLVLLCDVLEHVPPVRVTEFLTVVRELLREDGLLVVVTPSALTGPHDVTRHFRPPGTPPEGLHLREYTLRDLVSVLRAAGFGGTMGTGIVASVLGLRPRLSMRSIRVKMQLEAVLRAAPRNVRERVVSGLYYAGLVAQPLADQRNSHVQPWNLRVAAGGSWRGPAHCQVHGVVGRKAPNVSPPFWMTP
jgi:2-polyprenyl-3-methyl-5-hydroxy-6-metoxy-1,4-benzoquinol methylase